jgi:hypothetical protein
LLEIDCWAVGSCATPRFRAAHSVGLPDSVPAQPKTSRLVSLVSPAAVSALLK